LVAALAVGWALALDLVSAVAQVWAAVLYRSWAAVLVAGSDLALASDLYLGSAWYPDLASYPDWYRDPGLASDSVSAAVLYQDSAAALDVGLALYLDSAWYPD
jgi:hypothetical protein